MILPLAKILPLSGGIVYVFGALLLKRAAELGADVWRTTRICNLVTALMFLPLALLGGSIPSPFALWQPAVVGLCFVAGQIFTLQALNIGDVSVATPVLGVKVLLVGLLTTLLLGQRVSPELWTAAVLSSAALGLLNFSGRHPHHRVGATIGLAAGAAASFALVDVFVQKWSPRWGAGRFLPAVMVCAALFSIALRRARKAGNPATDQAPSGIGKWIAAGAVCLGLQAAMIVSSIALFGQATMANVLYSSRGLWSVLAVALLGHRFSNREGQYGLRVLAWRFVGAALLMAAILIVLLKDRGLK